MFIKSSKGQIAIFVVLIFQVLFILFAMTINIALVVHDKINFQNSLDLATYYGAKKQAEVLNAMAHINYQMRQNWKLLAWRYRILGTLLQNEEKAPNNNGNLPYWCPQNNVKVSSPLITCRADSPPGTNICNDSKYPYPKPYCDKDYFVCISQKAWLRGMGDPDQNLCEKKNVEIPRIENLQLPSGWTMPATYIANRTSADLRAGVDRSCPKEGALNWLMVQMFLTHFRLDQQDRKHMMKSLYDKTLKVGKDLDGNKIFDGAKQVFYLNLTRANKKNVVNITDYGLKEFNSFKNIDFENIFKAFNVLPLLQFADAGNGSGNGSCNVTTKHQLTGLDSGSSVAQSAEDAFKRLANGNSSHALGNDDIFNDSVINLFRTNSHVSTEPSTPFNPFTLTLGFSKESKKMLFYGLAGEFNYQSRNQIFSLDFGNSKLPFKASAFAKAFGGRFGPQFKERDHFIPVNHPDGKRIPDLNGGQTALLLQPNYSRWPGDKWGLIDRRLHANSQIRPFSNFLNKLDGYNNDEVYTIEAFFHLIFYTGLADDPLSRPPLSPGTNSNGIDPFGFMRVIELMAVYPDIFDLSYYSISSNYHETYFLQICKLLKGAECQPDRRNSFQSSSSSQSTTYIRGDFGWPETHIYLKENQRNKQVDLSIASYFLKGRSYEIDESNRYIQLPQQLSKPPRIKGVYNLPALTQGRIFYPWLVQELPHHLLSSWSPTTKKNRYDHYAFPSNSSGRFMDCQGPALLGKPVSSACAFGGRSGYSVKLISCKAVKDFPSETARPPNIIEFCP